MNINESFRSLMILSLLKLWISEITYLLTPYSVDQLVSFSNRKISDSLFFMKRMDRLLFVHMIKLIHIDAETSLCSSDHAD